MSLLTLQTNLKSLKFGVPPASDRPGGGNSGQPYIKTTIPGTHEEIPGNDLDNEDFLLRGGINAIRDTATDLKRLGKFFVDKNSPNGMLFIAKQNLLSRIATRTQASGIGLNEGVYTPLSTLAQAGINFSGGHIPKQGLIPFRGPNTYLKELNKRSDEGFKVIGNEIGEGNRLVQLTQVKIDDTLKWERSFRKNNQIAKNPTDVLNYTGGPGSAVGIGKTSIEFATDQHGNPLRTGINNPKLTNNTLNGMPSDFFVWRTGEKVYNYTVPGYYGIGGVSSYFTDISLGVGSFINKNSTNNGDGTFTIGGKVEDLFSTTVYPEGDPFAEQKENNRMYDNGSLTMNQNQLSNQLPSKPNKSNPGSEIQDFRRPLIEDKKSSTIMSLAPSYKPKELKTIDGPVDSRIRMVSPGQRGNVIDYDAGKLDLVTGEKMGPVDKINALPIYSTSLGNPDSPKGNDLVKFRIAAINNSNPSKGDYIHFRAFIDSFSDSYNATWNSQKYMGRGEPLYKYDSFNRSINMAFTVAAQSREEIMVMYRKLNYLVSNLSPDYTDAGYMAGPLVQLTLGGWCYELPGFIKSLTLEIPQESPWEIGIPNLDRHTTSAGGITFREPTVKEMPMICKVNSFEFQPIEKFVPSKQVGDNGFYKREAPQRYIALANGVGEKFNNYGPISTASPAKKSKPKPKPIEKATSRPVANIVTNDGGLEGALKTSLAAKGFNEPLLNNKQKEFINSRSWDVKNKFPKFNQNLLNKLK